MAIVQGSSVFPFVVELVTLDRVRFWSEYAGQVLTQSEFNVVSWVYSAFWMEAAGASHYQHAVESVQGAGMLYALGWLDLVVSTLGLAMDYWQRVVKEMEQQPVEGLAQMAFAERWCQEANLQHAKLQVLRQQVANYVFSQCAAYGVSVPQNCQAFFVAS